LLIGAVSPVLPADNTFILFFLIAWSNFSILFQNSSHSEHNSSVCGLNCENSTLLLHKMHSVTTFKWHKYHQNLNIIQKKKLN